MPNKLPDNRKTSRLNELLYCRRNIKEPVTNPRGLDPLVERTLSNVQKLFGIFRYLADRKRHRHIAIKTIQKNSTINSHNIAFFQLALSRNAVNNLFIDRCAERVLIASISLEGRPAAIGNYH